MVNHGKPWQTVINGENCQKLIFTFVSHCNKIYSAEKDNELYWLNYRMYILTVYLWV